MKAALAAGRSLQGAWSMSGSPVVVEALAWCGADYMVLDPEHSVISMIRDFAQLIGGSAVTVDQRSRQEDPAADLNDAA